MTEEKKTPDIIVLDEKTVGKIRSIVQIQANLNQSVQLICETVLNVLNKDGNYQLDFTGSKLIEVLPSETEEKKE